MSASLASHAAAPRHGVAWPLRPSAARAVAVATAAPLCPLVARALTTAAAPPPSTSAARPAALAPPRRRAPSTAAAAAATPVASTSTSTAPSTSLDERLSLSGMAGVQAAGGPNTPPVTRPLTRPSADGGGGPPPPPPGGPHMATLLVQCPDAQGVVAALAQLLAGLGCNILASDQHTDAEAGAYFQRIRFDYAAMVVGHSNLAVLEAAIAGTAARFDMDWAVFYDAVPKKVAIFCSKAGHCLWDLLIRAQQGDLPNAEVVAVIANHPDLEHVAASFGVPFFQVPSSTMGDAAGKADQEARIEAILAQTGADLHVLARWMNVFSSDWCSRHAAHTINIHHGFLPAFQGARPYHQAHARGVKVIGSSAHFATARLDEGPLIEQDVVRISHRDAPSDMVRKGRDLERLVLAKAVRAVLSDRVLIQGSRTVVFDE